MNTEDLLTDLFAHDAQNRPDPVAVLDAVHHRIDQDRTIVGVRAASAVGAAATVAAIAVGATVFTAPSGHHTDPAGGTPTPTVTISTPATQTPSRSAAPTTVYPIPTAPTTVHPTPTAPTTVYPTPTAPTTVYPTPPSSAPPVSVPGGAGRSYSTINAGWLPGPATQNPTGTSNQAGFEERDWDVSVDGVALDVIIWIEPGPLPARTQATGGGKSDYRDVTVNGHAGREFRSTNITIIAFDLGNGTIAYVGPSVKQTTAAVTSARIATIAAKVAQNMQFHRHDPIPGR